MTRYMLFLLTALLAPAWAQDEPPVALLRLQQPTTRCVLGSSETGRRRLIARLA